MKAIALKARIKFNLRCGLWNRFICPACLGEAVLLNVERVHFEYCEKCRVFWCTGSNLYGAWRHENEDIWLRNTETLNRLVCVDDIIRG